MFFKIFLNKITVTIALTKNILSCVSKLIGIKRVSIATNHAAMPKKNKIKPGTVNSNRKNANPTMNQSTEIFINSSMSTNLICGKILKKSQKSKH